MGAKFFMYSPYLLGYTFSNYKSYSVLRKKMRNCLRIYTLALIFKPKLKVSNLEQNFSLSFGTPVNSCFSIVGYGPVALASSPGSLLAL